MVGGGHAGAGTFVFGAASSSGYPGGGALSWPNKKGSKDDKQKDHLEGPWWMIIEPPNVAIATVAKAESEEINKKPLAVDGQLVPFVNGGIIGGDDEEEEEERKMAVALAIEPVPAEQEDGGKLW